MLFPAAVISFISLTAYKHIIILHFAQGKKKLYFAYFALVHCTVDSVSDYLDVDMVELHDEDFKDIIWRLSDTTKDKLIFTVSNIVHWIYSVGMCSSTMHINVYIIHTCYDMSMNKF